MRRHQDFSPASSRPGPAVESSFFSDETPEDSWDHAGTMPDPSPGELRPPNSRTPLRRTLVLAGGLFLLGAWAGGLAGLLGSWFWFLDLFSHWPAAYLPVSSAGGVLLYLGRARRTALLALPPLAWNLFLLAPWYLPSPVPPPSGKTRVFRALSCNLYGGNRNKKVFLALVRKERPDLLGLMEVTPSWWKAIEPLFGDYPFRIARPRPGVFGIALLSRHPLKESEVISLGAAGVPSVTAVLHWKGSSLRVLVTHPPPPIGAWNAFSRDSQLQAVGTYFQAHPGPAILLGDLNASMWSAPYREMAAAAGLRNARISFGILPTWPTFLPSFLRIPLDHCLLRGPLQVLRCRTGPPMGSDHLPLLVDLAIPLPENR